VDYEHKSNEPAPGEPIVAPPSWIELRQRAACDGSTALSTFQGMLSDEIVLPQGAMDSKDPMAAVRATLDFTAVLENQAFLIPGEYALEALTGKWAIHYIEETRAGGHVQYGAATHWDDLKVRAAMAGLRSMNADPYLALLTEMKRLVDDPKRGKKYKHPQASHDAAVRDLDKRFAELELAEPIAPRFKLWLKSLRKVKVVPDAELNTHLQRIANLNVLYPQRRAEGMRAREARERRDPAFTTARALCEMAGVLFLGLVGATPAALREHWPDGPDRQGVALNVTTDHGVRTALVYEEGGLLKKRVAVLIAPGEALPQGSLALSREDFDAINGA
jgi:hypothetical protein